MRQFLINLLWHKEKFNYTKEGVILKFTVYRRPWKNFNSEEVRQLLRDDGWEYYYTYTE